MSELRGGVELELRDPGAVGQARLVAKELAHELGAVGEAADRLVLVVSELATNLVVHGGGGTITLQPRPGRTIAVVAEIDEREVRGRAQATLGQGLALVRRLSASVSIEPGQRVTAVVGVG